LTTHHRLLNLRVASDVLIQSDLDESLLPLLLDACSNIFNESLLSMSLELSPAPAFNDLPFILGQVVDAVLLQLVAVVSVSDEQDLQDSPRVHEVLQIARTYLHESWQHEVVGVDHQLGEELSFLLLNIEVV
jgi:hypothetical protein